MDPDPELRLISRRFASVVWVCFASAEPLSVSLANFVDFSSMLSLLARSVTFACEFDWQSEAECC